MGKINKKQVNKKVAEPHPIPRLCDECDYVESHLRLLGELMGRVEMQRQALGCPHLSLAENFQLAVMYTDGCIKIVPSTY